MDDISGALRPSVRKAKRVEQVAKLYGDGLTASAIAERLGVSPATIAADLRAAGIAARKYERRDVSQGAA